MLNKLKHQTGETLLETMIGLVIIGLVMMCLPMAVTATANINSKVAEQDVVVTLDPADTVVDKATEITITCTEDNVGNKDTITAAINSEVGSAGVITDTGYTFAGKTVKATGAIEKDRFYYYDFTIE